MYNISSPALHAANLVFRHFDLHERKDVVANVNNVARLIDLYTQIHKIETVLKRMFTKTQWLNQDLLLVNLEQTRGLLRETQQLLEGLPQFQKEGELGATAASYTAAKALMEYYVFVPNPRGQIPLTLRNIAVLIESSCGICRIEELRPMLNTVLSFEPQELRQQLKLLRTTLRALEVVRNRLPAYAPKNLRRLKEGKRMERPKLTSEKQRELKLITEALQKAVTPEEQLAVMRKAQLA